MIFLPCPPGFSLSSSASDLDYPDMLKLAQAEKILFGSIHRSLPSKKRIEAIEVELFGEHHQGPYHPRIEAIEASLGSGKTNLLMPPLAPELDRGGSITHADGPPSAPDINALNDRPKPSTDIDALKAAGTTDKAKGLLRQALQLYSTGQISEAEATFKRVLAVDRDNTDAYFNLGAIAESRGDFEGALAYYQEAVRTNPNDTELQNAALAVQRKLNDASAQGLSQVPVAPSVVSSAFGRQRTDSLKRRINEASGAYRSGNYDKAIQILKEVALEAPNEADVRYALSQCYKAKHQFLEARSAINLALRLNPNNQLYMDAASDLDRRIASGSTSNRSNQFGSGYDSSYDTIASDTRTNRVGDTNAPVGQITPFTGVDTSATGWQSTAGTGGYIVRGGYLPGFARRSYGSYSTTSRIQRAAIGTVSGAAIGALFGGGYRSRGRSALIGGTIGGLFGLLSGW